MPIDMLTEACDRASKKIKAVDGNVQFDPLTWIAIFSAVVQLLQMCNRRKNGKLTDAEIAAAIRKPTMMQQIALRRAVTSEIGSRTAFRRDAAALVQSLIAVGNEADDDEITLFVSQALEK